ncbi:MAG: serine/threonine protein kinase [Planctomycetes bacterium]|nr:serine/threonine protein kinase [Planctomycetota bacterium]
MVPPGFGATLGPYRLEGPLDAGAQGTVYRARHLGLDRPAAIKILDPALARVPSFVARFAREARLAARIDHPNVVRVFDAKREGDVLYLAMALIDGKDLGRLVRGGGPLAVERAVRIACEAGDGIAAAHALGIVHRDVKPGNVLIEATGDRALVSDFGMARGEAGDPRLTAPGSPVGTPATMAPEVCRGLSATPASDQYSLAATLFFALAGRYPFEAPATLGVLEGHMRAEPPDLAAVAAGCPEGVAAAVRQAMAKDAAARFPSVAAFVAALRECVPAARPAVEAPPPSPSRRRTGVLLAVAGTALALFLAAAALFLSGREGADEPAAEASLHFAASRSEQGPGNHVDLVYDFAEETQVSDFRAGLRSKASWIRGQGVKVEGTGAWAHSARFRDVEIEIEFEPGPGPGVLGLAYIQDSEHHYSGRLEKLSGEAFLVVADGVDETRSPHSARPARPWEGAATARLAKRGDRIEFEILGSAVPALSDSRYSVGSPGVLVGFTEVVVRSVRLSGELDPDWVKERGGR